MANERVKSITKIYYSNPKIQEAIFNFAKDRETVPRYVEAFGKRPDALQYPSDVMGLVNKGATSFHASEELWKNPLNLNSDMSLSDLAELRKSWDLLIDIDSPYLDYSKIAAELIIEELEKHGINNYGIKFSGSKGFHIIVPAIAFPEKFEGVETSKMFPEWPRAISEYLMYKIRSKYNKTISQDKINFKALKERTNLSEEDITTTVCPNCGGESKKGVLVTFQCDRCKTTIERPNPRLTKRKLKCFDDTCPGFLDIISEKELFFCENCKTSNLNKKMDSGKKVTYTTEAKKSAYSDEFKQETMGEKIASLDLVLVASRHLFRMPYSLHEKTALASVVINKEDLKNFSPKDANPLKITVKDFYPTSEKNEALRLLESALSWKKINQSEEETINKKKYENYGDIDLKGVPEELFPKPIKILLKGLKEGRKRGLFVLLTFLKSLNFPAQYINDKVREWNKLNEPPLKEGYIKSQIEWHLKQKKKILPPNYKNDNFYKDLKLIETYPQDKNPISEVLRQARKLQG